MDDYLFYSVLIVCCFFVLCLLLEARIDKAVESEINYRLTNYIKFEDCFKCKSDYVTQINCAKYQKSLLFAINNDCVTQHGLEAFKKQILNALDERDLQDDK
jgi:hypothetical protein